MSSQNLDQYLEFAKDLAKKAGQTMNRYFQSDKLATEWKNNGSSPVTVADTQINTMVINAIKSVYPEHGVIGEEESHEPKRSTVWVVDPIDGTTPYLVGMPNSTFCLALVEDGNVLVSVVYDPFQDRLFTAVKGQGAYCNDKLVHVSNDDDFKNKYVMMFRTPKADRSMNNMYDALQQKGAKTISIPSFSYCGLLVAEGHFIAACMQYGSQWDAAAISLIVQEAGGMATDTNGKPRRYNEWGSGLIISNGKVHDRIINLIK